MAHGHGKNTSGLYMSLNESSISCICHLLLCPVSQRLTVLPMVGNPYGESTCVRNYDREENSPEIGADEVI